MNQKVVPPWWPHECQDQESCARHGRCGYFGCRHEDRYIGAEIELARLRAALEEFAAETEREFVGDGEHDTTAGWVTRPTARARKARAALDG
jgi:hypothetical protein